MRLIASISLAFLYSWSAAAIESGDAAIQNRNDHKNRTPAVAKAPHPALQSTLGFSGYHWIIKDSLEPVGPGPNLFSRRQVWIDPQKRLHLKISRSPGTEAWQSSEIWPTVALGYGTYTLNFAVDHPELWDDHVVFGAFTWDYKSDPSQLNENREIDFEISRWGETNSQDAQYVVQPLNEQKPGSNLHRFDIPWGHALEVIYTMTWTHTKISFKTTLITQDHQEHLIAQHEYHGPLNPSPGDARFHLNLWLFQGKISKPAQFAGATIRVNRFSFHPLESEPKMQINLK